MKKLTFLSLALSASIAVFSQTKVQKEQVLSSSGKDLGFISASGVKSASGGPATNMFFCTPGLGVTNIKNSGFLIREGYKFTKYNDQYLKEWEKEIEKTYGYSLDAPRGESVGDQEGIFFYEYTTASSKWLKNFSVTFFDNKGNPVQKAYKLEEKPSGVAGSFLNAKGLNILLYNVSKTDITYELLTFSRQSLQMNREPLALHSDPLEAKTHKKHFIYLGWGIMNTQDDKTILAKSYFVPDDVEISFFLNENPAKKFVCKTIELGTDNKLKNPKDFTVKSLSINGSCLNPQLFYDATRDEIYAMETYMNSYTTHGGVYFLKFKYSTGENLTSTTTATNQSLQAFSDGTALARDYEDPHSKKVTLYSTRKIVYYSKSGTFDFWNLNGLAIRNYEYFWARFDNSANQLTAATFVYNISPGQVGQLSVFPKEINNFAVLKEPHKANPIDLIFDLTKQIDVKKTAYSIVEKPDHYTVITISEDKGEFKAYKINK